MLTRSEARRLADLPLKPGERNRVRLARGLDRVTQTTVGTSTGLGQGRVSLIERGGYVVLPIESARALAKFFGCTIEALFPEIKPAAPLGTAPRPHRPARSSVSP